MAPGLDEFDVLLEVVLSLVRVIKMVQKCQGKGCSWFSFIK